ncbi:sialate O-acetylesterase [Pseudomonas sp. IT-P218]|uniref:sialate O-acetylesterase n=1 Tax=Pseudomonas sp. IT-P218 TaxID=3026449 RepID=UPI0039DF6711
MELKSFFVQDDQGNKLPGAVCYMYQRGTESIVEGLRKPNGEPLPNPFNSDNDAKVQLGAPNGLYDIRVSTPTRDYRIPLQFNDVSDVLEQANTAATRAETARDSAHLTSGVKTTIEEGLLSAPEGGLFSVLAASTDDYVSVYQKVAGAAVYRRRYPSGDLVRNLDYAARFAIKAAVPRSMADSSHPWSVVDESRKVILGVRKNGIVDAVLDRMPGLSLLGDYAWCICDENKVVLLGIKWSGELVTYPSALASTPTGYAWDEGVPGKRDIFTLVDGVPYQLTSSGDNTSPEVLAGQVHYIERNGAVISRAVPVPEAGSVASFVNSIIHVISLGQSLSCGINSGTPVTQQPPSANRILTIKDGIQLDDEKGVLSADMVAPFKPMVAKTKEPPIMQMAAEINRARYLPATAGLLVSNHGRGGQGITQLNKGTIPYQNSLTAIAEAKAECDRKGWPYRIPCICWNQGQHDGGMAAGVYYGHLVQLQADYEADIQAITGQTGRIPMVVTQMSNWTAPTYNRSFSNIPHEQYQVALDFPDRFVVAGPQYWLPSNSDGIHLPAVAYSRDGIALAGAVGAMIKGEQWKPTACVSAVRNGLKVTLRFNVPHGPLVIDTVNVSDPGFWGLRWIDSTSSASIVATELVGYDAIEVTLSNEPTGSSPIIGVADIGIASTLAGPTTGPRTCIRDSSPRLDRTGLPVYNWACHNRVSVITI